MHLTIEGFGEMAPHSPRRAGSHVRAAWRWCVLAAAFGSLCGCGATQASCSAILAPAVVVTVVDSSENPVCDVTVRIQGGQVDVQQDLTANACFASAGEQAGAYTVTVSRAGSSLAISEVQVTSGECGGVQEKVLVHVPTR